MNPTPAQFDRIFSALANRARRRMLDTLKETPGITIADLCRSIVRPKMSGVGVLKHVRALERAGLVISRREGRVRRLYFNAVPIQLVYDQWTDEYTGFWAARMADIKGRLEGRAKQAAPQQAERTGA